MDPQYDTTPTPGPVSQVPFPDFRRLWQEERHWLIVLLPLLLTLFIPIQWLARSWSVLSEALGFQPFVWLGVLYLAWAEREAISAIYRGNAEIYPPESKHRRGTPLVFYAGCLLLLLSYVTTLSAVAIGGFLIAVVGTILYLYGPTIVKTLWRPALLALTMIPVPGTVMDIVTGRIQQGGAAIAGAVLKLFYSKTFVTGNFITVGEYTAQVNGASSGLGILLPVLVLTLFLALLRQIRVSITLILLGSAAGIVLLVNTIRIVAMGLVGMQNKALADILRDANPWFFVALCFYFTYLLAGRIGPRTYQPDEDDEE